MTTINTLLRGVNFRPSEARETARNLSEGNVLTLEKDTENEHDATAVRVLCEDEFIGFVAAAHSKEITDLIDSSEYEVKAIVTGRDESRKAEHALKVFEEGAEDEDEEDDMDNE
jgi:hypothetical protein